MKVRVIRSTGSWYKVIHDNKEYEARLKGKFRTLELKSTNPIAVGDWLECEELEDGSLTISEIYPRDNYIIRKSTRASAQTHILASNIDQAVLIISLKLPKTSLGFIDRFLVLTESFRIPSVLVFNKVDLLKEKDLPQLQEAMDLYSSLGYRCVETSMEKEQGLDVLNEVFDKKTSLVAGHSGVGKSTILNYLNGGLNIKTTEVSNFSKKGKHTTTFVEMHKTDDQTYVIDSPGIKELGLVEIDKAEVSHYFKEFRSKLNQCKFHNCTHVHEPKCAILEAVENGEIHPSRYYNYLGIIEGEDFKNH